MSSSVPSRRLALCVRRATTAISTSVSEPRSGRLRDSLRQADGGRQGCVIRHMVHLGGCTVGSVSRRQRRGVAPRRSCRPGSLVGSNAVVPAGVVVPTGAMALGVPTRMRENTVRPIRSCCRYSRTWLGRWCRTTSTSRLTADLVSRLGVCTRGRDARDHVGGT
jgi:hypothetical protein